MSLEIQHDSPMRVPARLGRPTDRPRSEAERVAEEVEGVLHEDGVAAALALLNGRTRFRFTGVYRAQPPQLHNIRLYDRENPAVNASGDDKPLEATYCSIVCETEAPFNTADAGLDERLAAHPARGSVVSYAGVPLRLPSGRTWGTLCHFDQRPRLLPPAELVVLTAVAPVLTRWAVRTGAGPRD